MEFIRGYRLVFAASGILFGLLIMAAAAEAAPISSKTAKLKTVEYLVVAENAATHSSATFRMMEKGRERNITGLEFTLPVDCNDNQKRTLSVSAADMPDWNSISKSGKAAGKYSYVAEYSVQGDAVVTVWFVLNGNKLALHARRRQVGVTCDGELASLRVTGRTKLSTKVYAPLIIHDDVDHYLNLQDGTPTAYLVAGSAKCPGFEINGHDVSIVVYCSTAGDTSIEMSGDGKQLRVRAETMSTFDGHSVVTTCETTGSALPGRDRWEVTTRFSYHDPALGLDCSSTFSESLVRW